MKKGRAGVFFFKCLEAFFLPKARFGKSAVANGNISEGKEKT